MGCGGYTDPSGFAIADGIFHCGSNAQGLNACWPLSDGTSACLHSAFNRELALIDTPDGSAVKAPASASPFAVELSDGVRCEVVSHAHHPPRPDQRLSWYSCADGRGLFARSSADPLPSSFDRTAAAWTADAATGNGAMKKVSIRKAWFATATKMSAASSPAASGLDQVGTANAFLRAIGAKNETKAAQYGTPAAIRGTDSGGIENVVYDTCTPKGGTPWTCVAKVGENQTDNVWYATLTVTKQSGRWMVTGYRPWDTCETTPIESCVPS